MSMDREQATYAERVGNWHWTVWEPETRYAANKGGKGSNGSKPQPKKPFPGAAKPFEKKK
jgi:hypothetical protein